MTGYIQQCTEMPQHQEMRYEEPSVGDRGVLAPVTQSQMELEFFNRCYPLTPVAVTQDSGMGMNELHGPILHPSFTLGRDITSNFSGTATPMTVNSSYSNSSSTVQSSQSNASLPPAASLPSAPFSNPILCFIGDVSQHERNRQKNRDASARCREKNKRYTQSLLEKERYLLSKKESLKACVADLQDEILALKKEILQHSHCDCEYSERCLKTVASQIV